MQRKNISKNENHTLLEKKEKKVKLLIYISEREEEQENDLIQALKHHAAYEKIDRSKSLELSKTV